MKTIRCVLTLLALVLSISACVDPEVVSPTPDPQENKPQPTPVGFPIDMPTSMRIGASGGTITSGDERMSVDIPAGALRADTDIIIQPITNFAPNGNGNAYQLSPEGIVFDKPIRITFKAGQYISATLPPLSGIAFQDTDGIWYSSGKFTWDEVNQTVSTETTHFSGWATFDILQIVCDKCEFVNGVNQLKVDNSAVFRLTAISNETLNDEVVPLVNDDNDYEKIVKEWTANGFKDGDKGKYGTLVTNGANCNYTAPQEKPKASSNPVQLSVDLRNLKYKDPKTNKIFNDLMVSTSIHIIGDFEWAFVLRYYSDDLYTGGLLGTAFTMKDSASMKVYFKDDAYKFSDFNNSPGVIIPTSKTDAYGNKSTVQSESFQGDLNIISATGVYTSSNNIKKVYFTLTGTIETPAFTVIINGQSQVIAGQSGNQLWAGIEFVLNDTIPRSIWSDPSGTLTATLTLVE